MTKESPEDIAAISQLIVRERESRDMGFWNRMKACFLKDSEINISWFSGNGEAFVEGSKDMAARGMKATHRLGPILVNQNGNRAVATLSGIIDVPTEVNGVELMLSSHCLMCYRVEKQNSGWGIFSFSAIYRRDEFIPAVLGQSITIPEDELKKYRHAYRNLSYSLALKGYEVNNDMPGIDRPETVRAMLEELFGWADLPVPD